MSYAKYIHLFVTVSCTGYLCNYPAARNTNQNVLQYLVSTSIEFEAPGSSEAVTLDKSVANTIDHFCKQGFITKEDIKNTNLLAFSCNKTCKERFECLARWHKEALKTSRVADKTLLHHHCYEENFDSVEVFLRVSFQLFPDESGLLFYGDYSEQDRAERSDVGNTLFTFEYIPLYLRDLLDEDGRSYHQALFEYCPEQVTSIPLYGRPRTGLISLVELETNDPVTGLLPFMTVATQGSVGCIYKVLFKHPTALVNCKESRAGQREEPITLKRKRYNNS
ncbi:predicted protein [Chaetoceros tenuissimus]|uniref:Uncharacterized protein n=1 Tax=Chaetoceros tenuissimus TaxID=426638 RepID=A0AAD3D653_9STRA|nr:predicted protein [Chaetoceros tenuissimus]